MRSSGFTIGKVLMWAVLACFSSPLLAEEDQSRDAQPASLPRWQLAPIANPYFFAWWKAPAPSNKHFAQVFPIRNQTVETVANEADADWWLGRRVWAFGWTWGTQGDAPFDSADAYEAYLKERVENGAPGVCIDEWVNYDENNPKNQMLAEACRRIKSGYPDFFIAAFTHMQSDALIEALKNGWVDLAIVESYPYVTTSESAWMPQSWTPELAMKRLNNAKNGGVLEKTIPAFWISPGDETFTEEWFEGWIKRWRTQFPQMPGLAPCFPGGHDTRDVRTQHLTRVCDRLIGKYYIEPAPNVRITAPTDGTILEAGPVAVEAATDKPAAIWKLFADSEQVISRQESGSEVQFEPVELPPGLHMLTVHAITNDWDRGAAQIAVEVTAPEGDE